MKKILFQHKELTLLQVTVSVLTANIHTEFN